MKQMTHRQRVSETFAFQPTDRIPFDLMEGTSWPELNLYFREKHNLTDLPAILSFLDCDFRWTYAFSPFSEAQAGRDHFSDNKSSGLLKDCETIAQLERRFSPNPDHRVLPDLKQFADLYPDHARVFTPLWMPAFFSCCMDFTMENALCLMLEEPDLIQAYVRLYTDCALTVLQRALDQGAAKYCDFYWIGDDFATNTSLIIPPALWRKLFMPGLIRQVKTAREAGLKVLFHSCGAVSDIYEDLIEMGVNAHCGVQTSARGMSAPELAAAYGGRLVIYGGVDAQTTLIDEDPAGVKEAVRQNIAAFAPYGGYVISNAHHTLSDLPGENIVAMAQADRY